MPVVNETLDLPGGTSPTATVTVELVGAGGHPIEGFTSTSTIVGPLTPTVTAGAWTATLVGNDDITPTGTVYKRTVKGRGYGAADYFEVPASGGPYDLADLITDVPGAIDPTGLALLAARVVVLEADPITSAEVDTAITANGSSGRELKHADNATVFGPLTTATDTDIVTDSVTVGDRPVLVEFDLPAVSSTDASAVIAQIVHGVDLLKSTCIAAPAGGVTPILNAASGTVRHVLRTPGTYTIIGRVYASMGSPIIGYNEDTPATLRFIEQ